jgi:dipeptidyl aminopeptidase/acylaminoacyl peptidase
VPGEGSAIFDERSNTVRLVASSETGSAVSPNGRFHARVQSHDIYAGPVGGALRRITSDGMLWYSFDSAMARSNPVEAPASDKAPLVRWIGTGPWFWIVRLDQRRVRDVWLSDTLALAQPKVRRQKMAFPGDADIPVPELWLVNAETGAAHRTAASGWDYLGNMDIGAGGIAASRDGNDVLFARISRGYDRVELAAASIADGSVRTVLQEPPGPSGVRYVEFQELKDGYIWKSDRNGWAHYYLYGKNGRTVRQITRGAFSVDRIVHVDEAAGDMVFTAFVDAKGSSGRSQLHRVRLDGTELVRLDNDTATHIVSASPDGAYLADTVVRPDAMPKLILRDRSGRVLDRLEHAEESAFVQHGWRPPVPLDLKAADGRTRIEGMMWLPPNMTDARYPVIVQAYPGPSNDVVPTGFVPAHPNAALAELGFVVVTFGQRGGAPTRGKDYQFFARRPGAMRDYAIEDNAAALVQLADTFPFVDLGRVGIWGRSGGGFMAATAMLVRPDLYKVGVSIAGNHDNNIYEQNSSEFNFGWPSRPYPTNSELAADLRGKLLIAHGDEDDDVHVAHSLRLVRSLIDAGKRFDLLILPGEAHANYGSATDRYLRRRTWEYFLVHLKGETPCADADLG